MKNLNSLFYQNEQALAQADFSKKNKVHDWRNYVGEFEQYWSELTHRERHIIFIMAESQASAEEWE